MGEIDVVREASRRRGRPDPGPRRRWAWTGSRALAMLALLLLFSPAGSLPALAQEEPRDARDLEALIQQMSPEERVGQLFLVPISVGAPLDPNALSRLVDQLHVGGVLLEPDAALGAAGDRAPEEVARLISTLQARAMAAESGLPLLVAAEWAGGTASPDGRILPGMTPLPSPMAIGATWQDTQAQAVGRLLGAELDMLGINLLLGPSLDLTVEPRPASTGDLGRRSFGGSPAWVGRLGRAFIDGVHEGSAGRVATAAGRYPGVGAADRGQEGEIAVVEDDLEHLRETDLKPFEIAARVQEGGDFGPTDAFLTALVRYRGIQRLAERPFALDTNGMDRLDEAVEGLRTWRQAGGLRVSPGLGRPTIRLYVDGEPSTSNPRRAIREALMAGNDILSLAGFDAAGDGTDDDDPSLNEIEDGIGWLVGEYNADQELRERVDDALLRILALKKKVYGGQPRVVEADAAELGGVGKGSEVVAALARQSLTGFGVASGAASVEPQPGEKILWVLDARAEQACPDCEPYVALDPERFLTTVIARYGLGGSGLARLSDNADVDAMRFRDLKLWLQDAGLLPSDEAIVALEREVGDRPFDEVDALIAEADWLAFGMRDVRPSVAPASDALRLFLRSRRAAPVDQRIAAFAFDAPYHLDTTELASLSAYHALYDPGPAFVEVAVRALFGDAEALGDSPVSVPGANYLLGERLTADPDQSVVLEPVGWSTEQEIRVGDLYRVRTSPIIDLNGNLVPDGTPITFRRYLRSGDVFQQDVLAETQRGRAIAFIGAEREGEVEISALAGDKILSDALVVRIGRGPSINSPDPALSLELVPVSWSIFLLSLSLILLAGVFVYGFEPAALRSPTQLVRLFLLSLAWGLAGYLLISAGGLRLDRLPGGGRLWPRAWNPAYQAPIISFFFAIIPVLPTFGRAIRARVR